jgi:hypothetical protein
LIERGEIKKGGGCLVIIQEIEPKCWYKT